MKWRVFPDDYGTETKDNFLAPLYIGEENAGFTVKITDMGHHHATPYEIEMAEMIVARINSHDALVHCLSQIMQMLPLNRDWLDPDIEKLAKEVLELAEGEK